jgi:uncharacterized membrane protein
MVLYILSFALVAVGMLATLSPQPWREAHRNQFQVVILVLLVGLTVVSFATGMRMFVSIAYAAMTLFTAVLVVGGYVKRSRVSGRAS